MSDRRTITEISETRGLPDGWETKRVDEVGAVKLGRQRSPQYQSGKFTTPYLRVANVFDGRIDESDILEMDFTPSEKETFSVIPGDILLNEGQSLELVGRSAIYEGQPNRYCFQNTLIRFRVYPPHDYRFFWSVFSYWLKTGLFMTVARQTTSVAHLGADRLASMRFPVPPPPVQRRISGILTTLDNLIEKTESLIAKYQAVKQGMMHDLFTRGVDAHGKLRPPQSEVPDLYKQSDLGWVPKEWEIGRLGDYLSSIDAGWSPDCIEQPPALGEWGVLKVSAVTSGVYRDDESKTLPPHLHPDFSLEVRPGDVLLARSNGVAELVGVAVQVQETRARLMLSDKVLRLNPDKSRLTLSFLGLTMRADGARNQIGQVINGSSGQRNISQAEIRNLVIAIPGLQEQHRITARLHAAQSQVQHEKKAVCQLQRIKSGLMHDLLTGKVSVRVDDEAEATSHA